MRHFRFLTGTVYAVIIDILNDESARNCLIFFLVFIYSLDDVLVHEEMKKSQNLAIKSSHLEFALGQ